MSFDTLKTEFGHEPFERITVKLEGCSNVFGTAPCTATGEQCFNSWSTCVDPANYAVTEKAITFCTASASRPKELTDIPFLKQVRARSGEPDPMRTLGRRGSISVSFIDAVHDDIGMDPYVSSRSYDPMERGTFWPRLKKRFPYWKNRETVWEKGFLENGQYFADNFKSRTYIIDSLSGQRGSWEMSAKDPLRLADDKTSKMPRPSRGILGVAIAEGASPTTIDIETPAPTEYAFHSAESFSAVRIGKQVFKYTGTTAITGGVRLTGVTRTLNDGYSTETEDHDIGDEVQKCLWLRALPSIRIVQIALEDFADVPADYITYADWLADHTTWLAGFVLTRLITEPEGVKSLVEEIIQQSGTWAYWWDDVAAQIRWSPVRPPDFDETPPVLSDDANIVKGSVSIKDKPDELINEYYFVYGQKDPTKKKDEFSNYKAGLLEFNSDSQSDNESGETKTETVYCRWHPSSNKANLLSISATMIKMTAYIPYVVEFEMHIKDDDVKTAEFVTMESLAILDEFGNPENVRLRVLQAHGEGDKLKYKAMQDFFRGKYARIAPGSLDGLLYSAATATQKAEYVFLADSGGLVDGDAGYDLL